MKIATFNIQNLFHRDKSLIDKPVGKCLTDWIQELDLIMRKPGKTYLEQERIKSYRFYLVLKRPLLYPMLF